MEQSRISSTCPSRGSITLLLTFSWAVGPWEISWKFIINTDMEHNEPSKLIHFPDTLTLYREIISCTLAVSIIILLIYKLTFGSVRAW